MRNQILLLTLLQVLYVSTSPTDPLEGPLWLNPLKNIVSEDELKEEIMNVESEENNIPPYNRLRQNDMNIKEKRAILSSLKSLSEKRALSMFARWGTINTIGKERNPIRSGYPPKSLELISTQTRGRILGQPLRWG